MQSHPIRKPLHRMMKGFLTFFGLELIILSFIAFLVYQIGKARERGTPLFVKGESMLVMPLGTQGTSKPWLS